MTPYEQVRVFDRFFRGVDAHAASGSGLGLAIVKSVMWLHGGQIRSGQPTRPGHYGDAGFSVWRGPYRNTAGRDMTVPLKRCAVCVAAIPETAVDERE